MRVDEYTPPESITCPRCGKPARFRPPARAAANGGWEADFECDDGHRIQHFTKPKQRRETPQ